MPYNPKRVGEQVIRVWLNSRAAVAILRVSGPESGRVVSLLAGKLLDRIAERLLREVDQLHGGIGTAMALISHCRRGRSSSTSW